jgi:hypothetical protein
VRKRDLPQARRQADGEITEREADRAGNSGDGEAEAVAEAAHDDAARAEAEHRERVGQRRGGAVDAKLRLHRG